VTQRGPFHASIPPVSNALTSGCLAVRIIYFFFLIPRNKKIKLCPSLKSSGKAPFRCPSCRKLFEIPAATVTTLPAAAAPAALEVEKQPQGGKRKQIDIAGPCLPSVPSATAAPSAPAPADSSVKKTASSLDDIKCEICEEGEKAATVFCVQCSSTSALAARGDTRSHML